MKHIHVPVDDGTYDRLKRAKDEHGGTWEDLILDTVHYKYETDDNTENNNGN